MSQKVCQVLERLFTSRGKPAHLWMDNGPEFIALALRGLCYRFGVNGAYIEPGKPWQNGFAESFLSRLWEQFLDGEALWSVNQAQTCLGSWRKYYNEERLHSRIGYRTPTEFLAAWREKETTKVGKAEANIGI